MSAQSSPSKPSRFRAGSLTSHMRLQEAIENQTQAEMKSTSLQSSPSKASGVRARSVPEGKSPAKSMVDREAQGLSPSKPGRFHAGSLASHMRLQETARAQYQESLDRGEEHINPVDRISTTNAFIDSIGTSIVEDRGVADQELSPPSTASQHSLPPFRWFQTDFPGLATPKTPLPNDESLNTYDMSYDSSELFDVSIKRPGNYRDLAKAYREREKNDLLFDRDVNEALDFRVTRTASLSFDRDAFELIIERSRRQSLFKRPLMQRNTRPRLLWVDRTAIYSMLEHSPDVHCKSIVDISENNGTQQETEGTSNDSSVQNENAVGKDAASLSGDSSDLKKEMKENILQRYQMFKEAVSEVHSNINLHRSGDKWYYTAPEQGARTSESGAGPTPIATESFIHFEAAANLIHEKVMVRDFADFSVSRNALMLTPLMLPPKDSSAEPTPSHYSSSTASLYSEINTSSLVENDTPSRCGVDDGSPGSLTHYTVSDNGSDTPSGLEEEEDYAGSEIVTQLDQEALSVLVPPLQRTLVEMREERLEVLMQRSLSQVKTQTDNAGTVVRGTDDRHIVSPGNKVTDPFSTTSLNLRQAIFSKKSSPASQNTEPKAHTDGRGLDLTLNGDISGFSLSHYQSLASADDDLETGSIPEVSPLSEGTPRPLNDVLEPPTVDQALTTNRSQRRGGIYGIDAGIKEYFSNQGHDISTSEAAKPTFSESEEDTTAANEPTVTARPVRSVNALRNAFAVDRRNTSERKNRPATSEVLLDLNPDNDPLLLVQDRPLPTIETVAGFGDTPFQTADTDQQLVSSSQAGEAGNTASSWWNDLPRDPNRGSLYLKRVAERERVREEFLRCQDAETIKAGVVNEQARRAIEAETLARLVADMDATEYKNLLANGKISKRLEAILTYPERRMFQEMINKVRGVKLGYKPSPLTEQWIANDRFKKTRKVIDSTREKGVFYNDAAQMKKDREEAVAQGATWTEDPEVEEVIRRFEAGEITRGAPRVLPNVSEERQESLDSLERANGIMREATVAETVEGDEIGEALARNEESRAAPALASRRTRGLSLFSRLFRF
ncbi:MAG: hypothetical protein MMC33_000595 [Icmadophila ericetorum]|nr:hypothetical protein [Icmadophila ericetorum]